MGISSFYLTGMPCAGIADAPPPPPPPPPITKGAIVFFGGHGPPEQPALLGGVLLPGPPALPVLSGLLTLFLGAEPLGVGSPGWVPVVPNKAVPSSSDFSHAINLISIIIYIYYMKTFTEWLQEMAGVGSIVSCKDINNTNFQIQGSLSNLNCKGMKKNKIPYLTPPEKTMV